MSLPELYVSAPGVVLPALIWSNNDVIARVRASFGGDEDQWKRVERAIRFVFRSCGSDRRHIQTDRVRPVADHALDAARLCLAQAGVEGDKVGAVAYAGIARDYFEPATACEVASKLGAERVPAWDVIGACAGPIVAMQHIAGVMAIEPELDNVLICSAAISGPHLGYDIQSVEDLDTLAAGLTIGNGAAAFLVSRRPYGPSGRLLGVTVEGRPVHYGLCRVPTNGVFRSAGSAMFALASEVPGHMRLAAERAGKSVTDIDMWLSHQPSNTILRDVARALEIEPARLPQLHQLYGNTESTAVPLSLRHMLDAGAIKPGMTLGLGSAAAGFTLATAIVEWVDPGAGA